MAGQMMAYPPVLNCTNCRQPIAWVAAKKDFLGQGRYLIVCPQCSMTIKLMDKWEADWNKKVYGIMGCEEEYNQVQPIIPVNTQNGLPNGFANPNVSIGVNAQPVYPPNYIPIPEPRQIQGGNIQPIPSAQPNIQPVPEVAQPAPVPVAAVPTPAVANTNPNPNPQPTKAPAVHRPGMLTPEEIGEIERNLTDQMKSINKQLEQLNKAKEALKGE